MRSVLLFPAIAGLAFACHPHVSGGGTGGSGGGSGPTTSSATSSAATGSGTGGIGGGTGSSSSTGGVTSTAGSGGTGTASSTSASSGSGGGGPAWNCDSSCQWLAAYGDLFDQAGVSVASDPAGNILIAGAFKNTIDLGGGVLTASMQQFSIFVAKLDPSGHHLWSKAFHAADDDNLDGYPAPTLATDAAGNVILGGSFSGTVDFGGGPMTETGSGDGFIVKLGPTGSYLWGVQYSDLGGGPSAWQTVVSVAVDPAGEVLAAGLTDTTQYHTLFVMKLGSAGNTLWKKTIPYGVQSVTVRTDGAGSVYLGGAVTSAIDFGGGPLPALPGAATAFWAKLDGTGNHVWSHGAVEPTAGLTMRSGYGIAVDAAKNVYLTGAAPLYDPTMPFDPGCGPVGSGSGFLVKLDAMTGTCTWSAVLQSAGGGGPLVVLDATDAPVVAMPAVNLVSRFTPSGTPTCNMNPGVTGRQAYGLALDAFGRLLMTGRFAGTVQFFASSLPSAGGRDAFLVKL